MGVDQLTLDQIWDRMRAEGICFFSMTSPVPGVRDTYEAAVSSGKSGTNGSKSVNPSDALASAFLKHTGEHLFGAPQDDDFEDLLG